MRRRAVLPGVLALAACHRRRAPAPPPEPPRYVLGPAYEAGGVWRYPQARTEGTETGLAAILPAAPHRTVTNQTYDPSALLAAHPTLQLPTAARVTAMDTGRSLAVLINDRGPADPARAIALSPRAATLLGITGGAPVRIDILPAETAALAQSLNAPGLALAAAPRGAVTARPLDAPGPARTTGGATALATAATVALPQTVERRAPEPVMLTITLGTFTHRREAQRQLTRAGEPGQITTTGTGQQTVYDVRLGPYTTVPETDAAFRRVLRAGVLDARIVAEGPS